VLAERKYVFVEGVAPLCRFVAICETWQSCALKSWHFLRFYQSFLIRSWRFILVFRLKEREPTALYVALDVNQIHDYRLKLTLRWFQWTDRWLRRYVVFIVRCFL